MKEIQVNKTSCTVYAMDEFYDIMATMPMGKEFYPGYNDVGEPRCNAPDGVYTDTVWVDVDWPDADDLVPGYGWGYINITDRGHALHGGGANLGEEGAMEPFQPLLPTLGCFRMHNADIYWLSLQAKRSIAAGVELVVHVVS